MSSRMITHWAKNAPSFHSAIDDLESFSWVLLWVALHSPDSTPEMMDWVVSLSDDSPVKLLQAKVYISVVLSGARPPNLADFSPFFRSVFPLLEKWFTFAIEAEKAVNTLARELAGISFDHSTFHAQLRDLSLVYYVKYLEAGVEFLRKNGAYGQTAVGTQTSENATVQIDNNH